MFPNKYILDVDFDIIINVPGLMNATASVLAKDVWASADPGVVEQGSHDELIAQGGIYAGLCAHQTGGFIGVE